MESMSAPIASITYPSLEEDEDSSFEEDKIDFEVPTISVINTVDKGKGRQVSILDDMRRNGASSSRESTAQIDFYPRSSFQFDPTTSSTRSITSETSPETEIRKKRRKSIESDIDEDDLPLRRNSGGSKAITTCWADKDDVYDPRQESTGIKQKSRRKKKSLPIEQTEEEEENEGIQREEEAERQRQEQEACEDLSENEPEIEKIAAFFPPFVRVWAAWFENGRGFFYSASIAGLNKERQFEIHYDDGMKGAINREFLYRCTVVENDIIYLSEPVGMGIKENTPYSVASSSSKYDTKTGNEIEINDFVTIAVEGKNMKHIKVGVRSVAIHEKHITQKHSVMTEIEFNQFIEVYEGKKKEIAGSNIVKLRPMAIRTRSFALPPPLPHQIDQSPVLEPTPFPDFFQGFTIPSRTVTPLESEPSPAMQEIDMDLPADFEFYEALPPAPILPPPPNFSETLIGRTIFARSISIQTMTKQERSREIAWEEGKKKSSLSEK